MAELRPRPPYSYRNDPAVPGFDDGGPIAIMDGDCALCASGARVIARLDRERVFRIGRTQSATGAALVRHYGLEPEDPETWLYHRGRPRMVGHGGDHPHRSAPWRAGAATRNHAPLSALRA